VLAFTRQSPLPSPSPVANILDGSTSSNALRDSWRPYLERVSLQLPYVQRDRILKGVVNNVTKFVDIGVHQDGFDHTTAPLNRYNKIPNEVARIEQINNLKVFITDTTRWTSQ